MIQVKFSVFRLLKRANRYFIKSESHVTLFKRMTRAICTCSYLPKEQRERIALVARYLLTPCNAWAIGWSVEIFFDRPEQGN